MTGYDFIVGVFGAVLCAFIAYDVTKGIAENNKANKRFKEQNKAKNRKIKKGGN